MTKTNKISQDQLDDAIDGAVELAKARLATLEADQLDDVNGGIVIGKDPVIDPGTTMGFFPVDTPLPWEVDLGDF